jgi:hypothetical protein
VKESKNKSGKYLMIGCMLAANVQSVYEGMELELLQPFFCFAV